MVFISNVYLCVLFFLFCFILFFQYVHKVILVTTMLDLVSLTAMAVNYTRAQTQRGPLTSQGWNIHSDHRCCISARRWTTQLEGSIEGADFRITFGNRYHVRLDRKRARNAEASVDNDFTILSFLIQMKKVHIYQVFPRNAQLWLLGFQLFFLDERWWNTIANCSVSLKSDLTLAKSAHISPSVLLRGIFTVTFQIWVRRPRFTFKSCREFGYLEGKKMMKSSWNHCQTSVFPSGWGRRRRDHHSGLYALIKNTTSLVLSVQHSTTRFSFLSVFFLKRNAKEFIFVIIRGALFHLNGIEQTPQ